MNSTPNPNILKYGFFTLRRAKNINFQICHLYERIILFVKQENRWNPCCRFLQICHLYGRRILFVKQETFKMSRRGQQKKHAKCIFEHQIFYKLLWKVVCASQKTSVFLHLLIRFTNLKMQKIFIKGCKKSDVQKYILYVFLPAAGGKFIDICSPEMQFLQGLEAYLTSKSQIFSPAAQKFDKWIW